jgi:hypothetical protein
MELGDDAKYVVKGERAILFQLESGASFDSQDVLYVPGFKKKHSLILNYGGHGFFRYFSERESTHMSIEI